MIGVVHLGHQRRVLGVDGEGLTDGVHAVVVVVAGVAGRVGVVARIQADRGGLHHDRAEAGEEGHVLAVHHRAVAGAVVVQREADHPGLELCGVVQRRLVMDVGAHGDGAVRDVDVIGVVHLGHQVRDDRRQDRPTHDLVVLFAQRDPVELGQEEVVGTAADAARPEVVAPSQAVHSGVGLAVDGQVSAVLNEDLRRLGLPGQLVEDIGVARVAQVGGGIVTQHGEGRGVND